MNKWLLALNGILLIAVGFLYYKEFGCKKCMDRTYKTNVGMMTSSKGGPSIAYVDLDSLNEKIEYIKTNKTLLESEQKNIENEYENAYRNLESQKNEFLKRGSSITRDQAEQFQMQLQQQLQIADSKKQSQTQKLNEKSYKFLEDIQKKLKDFLAEYNQQKNFTYIFTAGNGLDYMVYKDSSLNITQDVVDGMNGLLKKK